MHRIEQIRNRETNVETWFITSLFLSRPNFITSLFIVSQFYHIPISPYPYVISFWHPIIRLSCHLSPISQFPLTPTLKKKNQKNRIPPLIRALLRFYSDKRILFSEGNALFLRRKARTRSEENVVTYVHVRRCVRMRWRTIPIVEAGACLSCPQKAV